MDNQPEFSLQSLRITFSDAIRYLNAKTEPKCPACSETVFEILTDENNHVGIGGIEFNQSPHMRMGLIFGACINCGYIMSFAATKIVEWLNNNPVVENA